jgi:hypothetical protein
VVNLCAGRRGHKAGFRLGSGAAARPGKAAAGRWYKPASAHATLPSQN